MVEAIESAVDAFALAPVAQAGGPYAGAPTTEIQFTGAGSYDPDSAIVNYAWDFNNDGTVDSQGPSPVASHSNEAAYDGLAVLTVTSADGGTNTATAEVKIIPGGSPTRAPGLPRAVSARDGGSGSIQLTWEAPTSIGDGPIGAYRVYSADGNLLTGRASTSTSVTIQAAPLNRDLAFDVEALNEFGSSPKARSNAIRLTTSPANQCAGMTPTRVVNGTYAGKRAIIGTAGNDVILGTDQSDIILGGSGNDIICSRVGDDLVFGGNGDDSLNGETGRDIILGGNGRDAILAGRVTRPSCPGATATTQSTAKQEPTTCSGIRATMTWQVAPGATTSVVGLETIASTVAQTKTAATATAEQTC